MPEGWETVMTVGSEEEAELMAGFLESAGVPSAVESSHSHEFPTTVGALALVRVEVPVERLEEARQLLESRNDGGDAIGDGEVG